MFKSYKTELDPTHEQKIKINQTIGNCRFIYNYYLAYNKNLYEQNKGTDLPTFISGYSFSKMINHNDAFHEQYPWFRDVSSIAVKTAMRHAEKAFKNFFKGITNFPKFKRKKQQTVKIHFFKNSPTCIAVKRHRIKIPTLGWVRLKEYGYIPTENYIIKNCTVSRKADRYYVSVLVDTENNKPSAGTSINKTGMGIDLGIKELAVCSDDFVYKNINKTEKVKKIKKKLRRVQRRLSRKYLMKNKQNKNSVAKFANIDKNVLQLQKLHARLMNIRHNYINQVISEIIKRKPSYITMENLNIKGMMKNRHLAKAVQEQCFYYFKNRVIWKCQIHGIEFREADRFYPSSKLCSCCENKKTDLKLGDRIYKCSNCGLIIDRDINAAINLQKVKNYNVIV